MTAKAKEREPKPPRFGFMCAVALELAILCEIVRAHAWFALLLCVPYSWFSATWQMVTGGGGDE